MENSESQGNGSGAVSVRGNGVERLLLAFQNIKPSFRDRAEAA